MRPRYHPGRASPALVAGLMLATIAPAAAQFPPDSLTNLEFFPKDTQVRAHIGTMRAFSFALGVRCEHCHVGEPGQPLETFDFPSDEKRTKRTARVMLRMVQEINRKHLPDVVARPPDTVAVECVTCHRGLARPKTIQQVLGEAIAAGGLDSAVVTYRRLRQQYYGGAEYDFARGALNEFAMGRARRGDAETALGLLELNADLNPTSEMVQLYLGEVHLSRGDTTRALASYHKALEINPDLLFAQRRIDDVTKP